MVGIARRLRDYQSECGNWQSFVKVFQKTNARHVRICTLPKADRLQQGGGAKIVCVTLSGG